MTLTGDLAWRMAAGALAHMKRDEERINALNVFPVPDGDTGTNMILTVQAAVEAASPDGTLSQVAEDMAHGALRGARGNSGTIVSQFFHGFYLGVKGMDEAGPLHIAKALESAAQSAYAAVLEPKEGTILTVGRRGAQAATAEAVRGAQLIDVIRAALTEAASALEETAVLLDVLREAGVVDAGGEGLVVGGQGAIAALEGKEPIPLNGGVHRADGHLKNETTNDAMRLPGCDDPHHRTAIRPEDIQYQYCTEFLISGDDLSIDAVKELCEPLGDSLMVVGSSDLLKVHIHTNRPGRALEIACDFGELQSVSIDNMKTQNQASARAAQSQSTASTGFTTAVSSEDIWKQPALAAVAVCRGDGFEDILSRQGVRHFVPGGQSMNPSVGQLIDAITATKADTVYLFPNNANAVMTAHQAAELAEQRVIVIPTSSVPQAVSATFLFDPDQPIEALTEAMNDAAGAVRVGEVTQAARDAVFNDYNIVSGDWMGLVDGQLVTVGKEMEPVLEGLLDALAPQDGELITLYAGEQMDSDALARHRAQLAAKWPQADVEGYIGGQPVYAYWISVE